MRENGFDVLTASAPGKEAEEVKKEGVEHVSIDMTRKITPLRDLVALWQLISLIRKFNPDIVHTHTPKAGLLGMVAARFCNVRVRLHTVAGLPLMEAIGLKRKILNATELITYKFAHRVYPNSMQMMKYIFENFNVDKSKFKVIGRGSTNGVNVDHFSRSEDVLDKSRELKRHYEIGHGDIVFSFVGRLVKDKGVEELLIAFDKLSRQQSCKLLLVGNFEEDLDPLSKASHNILSTNKNIVTTGFQTDIRPYLAASDIFVFPSYREGFPNVVLQACSMGLPSIVSDINGCNEIIVNGENGVIVKPKDTAMLFNAMANLASQTSLRNAMAERARAAVAGYDQKNIWNLLRLEYLAQLDESQKIL